MTFRFMSYIVLALRLLAVASLAAPPKTYRYFGYGSNVLVSTMKALRRIEPIDATAAVLPDYELRFDGSEKSRLEPSAAFVRPAPGKQVHGVMYTLTADDFAKVGTTEGVPFGYRWKRCSVHTYVGDGEDAGSCSIKQTAPVDTMVLISPNLGDKHIPPSPSYLGLIKEGAKRWKFDRKYQEELEAVEEARNLIIPQGLSGILLQVAEAATGTARH
eukprot:scaffold1736_cov127-Cylindrotheca_fusiformis.AAC.19